MKLGTRKSLLAWAQSGWVGREIERLNPGTRVELYGIVTQGDRIQDVPLQKVEGKEFFVAELDRALLSGEVDLTVHSLKDLSLERPPGLVRAAIPARENPRDVLLLGPMGLSRLRSGERLLIGTSSPRRLENLPAFLTRALPQPCSGLEFKEIRGNVNTRLARVHERPGHEKYLDGVILAFAGLIRLWKDQDARPEIQSLLEGVRWMVLPLKDNPTAPGQGALAIECRANDSKARELIAKLHCATTAAHVARERRLLEEWGGGCHQKFGATAHSHPELGEVFYVRGRKPDGSWVESLDQSLPTPPSAPGTIWDGSLLGGSEVVATALTLVPSLQHAVFVAHSRAVAPALVDQLKECRVWSSGVTSWLKLAQLGLWVEGCAEGLGFEELLPTLGTGVLQLPDLSHWSVLTHEGATQEWSVKGCHTLGSYRISTDAKLDPKSQKELEQAQHLYWSSGSQFERLHGFAKHAVTHACGAGKTVQVLRKAGVEPRVFLSSKEWKQWLKSK